MQSEAVRLRTKNPHFRETILDHVTRQKFMKHIRCELTTIELGHVEAEIVLREEHQQQLGYAHGGLIATIADVAAGFAGFTLVGPEEHTVTAEIKISYFRPAMGKRLQAIGRVIKPGRKMHFCEAEVWCFGEQERVLVAKATTTMAIIQPKQAS